MTNAPTTAITVDTETALVLAQPTVIPAQPTITTTSAVDSWTVHLGPVNATVRYEYEDNDWSTVYVSDDVAEGVDPQLAALAEQERNLGDNRGLGRDIDPQIDDLYDRLNERTATIKTMIAVAVLPKLGAVLDNHGRLLDKVEFDAYAGCTSCKCSPGVKAPYARRHGSFLQISIDAPDA
jgi:hypothetical protein